MADTTSKAKRKLALARLQVRHEYREDPDKEENTANIHRDALTRVEQQPRPPQDSKGQLALDVVDRLQPKDRLWFALAVVALIAFGLWLKFGQ